jgi:hypothetical protein
MSHIRWVLLLVALGIVGCILSTNVDDTRGALDDSALPTAVAGHWVGTWESTSTAQQGQVTLNLQQVGMVVSGEVRLQNSPCGSVGTFSGQVDTDEVHGTGEFWTEGWLLEVEGVLDETGTIEGTYTVVDGRCDGDWGTVVVRRQSPDTDDDSNDQDNGDGDGSFEDRDCPDFLTHAEAQAFFLDEGGPDEDPHDLDRDHDGIACEDLP